MVASTRRGMSWPTAWAGVLPVYGLAILIDAVFPLFAVPIWVIFLIYAGKVVSGARAAEDPWRGRPSPGRFLLPVIAGIAVEDVGLATLSVFGASGVVTAIAGTIVGLSAAAWFVAASAPPGVRDERRWLGLGIGAGILNALALPATLVGPFAAVSDTLVILVARLLLAGASFGGFLLASRSAARRRPVVARKVPRE